MYKKSNILREFLTGNGTPGKLNAPTMAYMTWYGKQPSPPISGREASHEAEMFEGAHVDKNIPRRAIIIINKCKKIELRSTCEGESERLPSYGIIRPKDGQKKTAEKITNDINALGDWVKASWNMGNGGLPRICFTGGLWYKKDKKEFTEWWIKIAKALVKIVG